MSEEKETIIPRMETIRTLAKESGVSYNCIRLWCMNGNYRTSNREKVFNKR